MSLIHWWPLNDATTDLGTEPLALIPESGVEFSARGLVTENSATFLSSSRHGHLKGTDLARLTALPEYTLSCWVYLTDKGAYNGTVMFLSSGNFNSSGQFITFGLSSYNASTGFTILNIPNHSSCYGGIALTGDNIVKLNKWYHITVTYKNGNTYGYINGNYVGRYAGSTMNNTNVNFYYIGAATYYNDFTTRGRINDFRIYDNALSKQEVRELSQGLMFHYSFNDIYAEEVTNLVAPGVNTWGKLTINVTGKHTGDGHYTITTTTANSGTRGQIRLYFPLSILTIGTSYYFSCKYKVVSGTGNLALVDWCDSSLTQKTSTNYGDYMILTAYCSTSRAYNSTYRFLDMNIDADSVVEVWDIQLQTNKVTPYIVGTRPNMLTNEAGYEEPMNVQNLVLSSDTNCGTYCGIFDSTKPTQIRMNPRLESATDVTVACWLYPQNGSTAFTDNALYSVISGTGISLYAYGRSNAWLSCANCLTLDAWNHIVTTYSATERIVYVNGKKVGSDTISGVFDARTSLDVGYGSTTTRALNGRISDFRVYRTTLSEDDVKILYESRASVDKEQNVFSNEFIEDFNGNMVTTGSWEQGGIQDADGRDANNMANRIRTKYLPVLGGLSYTYKAATGINIRYIHYYDADNKWIIAHSIQASSTTKTTPENAAYVRWVLQRSTASLEIPVADIADYGAVMMPTLIYEVTDIVDSAETVVNKTYNVNTNDICENHKAGIYKKGTMTGRNFNEV
jgi:hypothetical protein